MKNYSLKVKLSVLIGILFLGISSAYAEMAEEYRNRGDTYYKQGDFT